MKQTNLLVSLLFLMVLSLPAHAEFGEWVVPDTPFSGTNDGIVYLASGDINGDGRVDAATLGYVIRRNRLLISTLDSPTYVNLHLLHPSPRWMSPGLLIDLGGSDSLDLVGGSEWVNGLGWYEYVVYAQHEEHWIESLAGRLQAIIGGDLDGDGDNDLVVATNQSDGVRVLLNEGANTWSSTNLTLLAVQPTDVALLDSDLDGDLDIIVGSLASPGLVVYANTDDGGWPGAAILPGVNRVSALTAADLDGNDYTDLAVAGLDENALFALLNQADGSVQLSVVDAARPMVSKLITGDIDRDGDLDLAAFSRALGQVSTYDNRGDNGWVRFDVPGLEPGISDIALYHGDLDDDLDLILANPAWNEPRRSKFGPASDFTHELLAGPVGYTFDLLATDFNDDTVPEFVFSDLTLERTSLAAEDNGFWRVQSLADSLIAFDYQVGHVNVDDRLDLIAAVPARDQFYLLAQQLDGSFVTADSLDEWDPRAVAVADFNGDGLADIATLARNSGLAWYRQMRNGDTVSWERHEVSGNQQNKWAVCAGDLENDGDIDLIMTRSGNQRYVDVFFNHGDGSFSDANLISNELFKQLFVVDLNGDGLNDIVGAGANRVSWWEAGPDGSFTEHILDDSDWAYDLAIGDFDSDGDTDLAVTRSQERKLHGFYNDGAGQFTRVDLAQIASQPYDVVSMDIDGDGDIDIVATDNSPDGHLHLFRNHTNEP